MARRFGVTLAAVLVMGLACLTQGGPAEATFRGGNGLVAYSTDDGCGEDPREVDFCAGIHIETADVRRPNRRRALTCEESGCVATDPAWSPSGKLLLYHRQGEVFLSHRDRSPDELVIDRGASNTTWSANGRRLVFSRGVRGGLSGLRGRELFVRGLRAGKPRRITRRGGDGADWSSRGEIAFMRYNRRYGSDVFLVRPDGRGLRRLTRGGVSGEPSWSPDGRLLAIERQMARRPNIVLINRRGRVKRVLTRKGGSNPVWSPDGSRIAFSRENFSKLYTVRARGGGVRRILPGVSPLNGQVAWQPRQAAYGHRCGQVGAPKPDRAERIRAYRVSCRRARRVASEYLRFNEVRGWRCRTLKSGRRLCTERWRRVSFRLVGRGIALSRR